MNHDQLRIMLKKAKSLNSDVLYEDNWNEAQEQLTGTTEKRGLVSARKWPTTLRSLSHYAIGLEQLLSSPYNTSSHTIRVVTPPRKTT